MISFGPKAMFTKDADGSSRGTGFKKRTGMREDVSRINELTDLIKKLHERHPAKAYGKIRDIVIDLIVSGRISEKKGGGIDAKALFELVDGAFEAETRITRVKKEGLLEGVECYQNEDDAIETLSEKHKLPRWTARALIIKLINDGKVATDGERINKEQLDAEFARICELRKEARRARSVSKPLVSGRLAEWHAAWAKEQKATFNASFIRFLGRSYLRSKNFDASAFRDDLLKLLKANPEAKDQLRDCAMELKNARLSGVRPDYLKKSKLEESHLESIEKTVLNLVVMGSSI